MLEVLRLAMDFTPVVADDVVPHVVDVDLDDFTSLAMTVGIFRRDYLDVVADGVEGLAYALGLGGIRGRARVRRRATLASDLLRLLGDGGRL